MRRLSGVLLAGAMLMLPAFSQNAGVQAQAPQKLTMEGDLALWSVAIRPDKTGDFEKVMGKIKDALSKSEAPEAKQQLAGWRVHEDVEADARRQHHLHPRHHARSPARTTTSCRCCTRRSRIRRSRRSSTTCTAERLPPTSASPAVSIAADLSK